MTDFERLFQSDIQRIANDLSSTVAVFGEAGTGRTTVGVVFCRNYPLVACNLESLENSFTVKTVESVQAFREAVESHIRGEITEDELRNLWEYFGHPDNEYEETVEHLRSYLETKVAKEQIADQLGVSSGAVYTDYPEQMEELAEGVVVVDGEEYAITEEFDEDDLDEEGEIL